LLDLTDRLRSASGQLVSDYLTRDESGNVILAADNGSGAPVFFRIADRGFSKSGVNMAQSSDINRRQATVREATITQVEIRGGGTSRLYLSNAPGQWLLAETGKTVIFPDTGGTELFWKAEFPPAGGDYISPFFSFINIEFKIKYLK
jgi:hypothetical protein